MSVEKGFINRAAYARSHLPVLFPRVKPNADTQFRGFGFLIIGWYIANPIRLVPLLPKKPTMVSHVDPHQSIGRADCRSCKFIELVDQFSESLDTFLSRRGIPVDSMTHQPPPHQVVTRINFDDQPLSKSNKAAVSGVEAVNEGANFFEIVRADVHTWTIADFN